CVTTRLYATVQRWLVHNHDHEPATEFVRKQGETRSFIVFLARLQPLADRISPSSQCTLIAYKLAPNPNVRLDLRSRFQDIYEEAPGHGLRVSYQVYRLRVTPSFKHPPLFFPSPWLNGRLTADFRPLYSLTNTRVVCLCHPSRRCLSFIQC